MKGLEVPLITLCLFLQAFFGQPPLDHGTVSWKRHEDAWGENGRIAVYLDDGVWSEPSVWFEDVEPCYGWRDCDHGHWEVITDWTPHAEKWEITLKGKTRSSTIEVDEGTFNRAIEGKYFNLKGQ
jgi:hypothetical protein